jgi:glycosyltransferase involved in cell wall biosynthesis
VKVVILTTHVPFVRGGAEIHAEGLRDALRAAGHEAEIVGLPFKWYPAETILPHMLSCRLIDLSESDGMRVDVAIGLKFPAYLVPHPRKVLWVLHQYRAAYDLWDHPMGDLHHHTRGLEIRDAIARADVQACGEAKAVFANSRNVADRLRRFNGVDSRPLYHPPLNAHRFYTAEADNYLFFPSRFTPTKRQHLVLEALAQTRSPVRVRFVSSAHQSWYVQSLRDLVERHRLADRVEFLESVSEDEKLALYARARAVLYPPVDEDYGYVTLEAMLASKPVVTCRDSGGPLEFVRHGETGLVTAPAAEDLARAMDQVWEDGPAAARMGEAGRAIYADMRIDWPTVIERLLTCA